MSCKSVFVLFALGVLVKGSASQFLGNACWEGLGMNGFGLGAPFAASALGAPFSANALGMPFASPTLGGCGVASTGGGLPCSSASPLPPVGVSVVSENVYEGGLAVGGSLPFLGTVALEGALPTAGAGAVSYGCGAAVGIAAEEGPVVTGMAPHAPWGQPWGQPWAGAFNAFPFAEGFGCGGYGPYNAFPYGAMY